MEIRRLTSADGTAFREIRLRALRERPDAFLVSAEEEEREPPTAWTDRLREKERTRDDVILGALLNHRLVGTVGYFRERFEKTRHRAVVWGMYVAPEARRKGVGRALLDVAIRDLKSLGDVDVVHLSVIATNVAARALYRTAGFAVWGLDRAAWKVGDGWLDEEVMTLRLRPRPD
jgi:ribosomal protein S18 acetylase RimI-like enzyme